MHFFVRCTDKPNHQEVRLANRAAHLEFLKANIDKVLIAGPTLTDDAQGMTGSVLVFDVADRAALNALLALDPYAKAGLFQSVEVSVYKKVFP
ncbi:YciI family protein [Telmatospirillum sp.]|uniref:YciI family protein n=1 Tax=Telmatospirillum sp. TaxID=2079197 RepID=UPI00283C34C2|nr:YciI family protein [Telmatospirillum sp.]MDR3439557.1 YciI family protein [Telmatospirillum sp.]